jgi:hypothetical protein
LAFVVKNEKSNFSEDKILEYVAGSCFIVCIFLAKIERCADKMKLVRVSFIPLKHRRQAEENGGRL